MKNVPRNEGMMGGKCFAKPPYYLAARNVIAIVCSIPMDVSRFAENNTDFYLGNSGKSRIVTVGRINLS